MRGTTEETLSIRARREWLLRIFFSVAVYTITYTIVFRHTGIGSDYMSHMETAECLHRENMISYFQANPYFMWHLLVRIFYKVFSMPMRYAASVVSALINVVVYLITCEIIKRYSVDKPEVISFCLMLVGPLYAPWVNPQYYLGQITPNTWHNPTNLMVKPFAVVCFFMIIGILTDIRNSRKITVRQWLLLSGLIFLSVVAKPSFAQGIIPGLGLYLVFFCIKNRFKNIMQYIYLCLTFVPGVLLMLYAASVYWGTEGARGSIKIGWLAAMKMSGWTSSVWTPLLLSFGFPLLYILFNWEKAVKRTDVQLSVCYFAAAWLEYALLYETVGTTDGNLAWAELLASFIVWTVIMICFSRDIQHFRMNDKKLLFKNTVLMIVFSIHLLCGSWYVCKQIIGPEWL